MTTDFSAILLAAGEGQRLRPITASTPKCLVPINGVPILDIWIELLTSQDGLKEIFINTSYLAGKVEQHIKNHKDRNKICLIHEPELLGTAGTIKKLAGIIKSEHIFIAHADNLSKFDPQEFFSYHLKKPRECNITMMTFEPDDPRSCGIVELNNRRIVVSYKEKPAFKLPGEANAAVYFFDKKALKLIRNMGAITDLSRDVIPQFVGRIFAWKNSIYHRDIGNPESYELGQTEFSRLSSKKKKR